MYCCQKEVNRKISERGCVAIPGNLYTSPYGGSGRIWHMLLSGFIGCTLHFIIQTGQTNRTNNYNEKHISEIITSVIYLPVSIYIYTSAALGQKYAKNIWVTLNKQQQKMS